MNNYIRQLLKYFLQGVVIIGPLSTTIWILWSIFYSVDNLIPHVSERFPGLVFVIILVGTTLIGYLGSRFLVGKFVVEGLNYILEHTPGIKFIYKTSFYKCIISADWNLPNFKIISLNKPFTKINSTH